MIKKDLAWLLAAIIWSAAPLMPSVAKGKHNLENSGAQIFQQRCASCHAAGGNSVNEKRPLAGSKELSTIAHFKSYLSAPPGHMPYYQDVVGDEKTLKALYDYCKTLKRRPLKQASRHSSPSRGRLAYGSGRQ